LRGNCPFRPKRTAKKGRGEIREGKRDPNEQQQQEERESRRVCSLHSVLLLLLVHLPEVELELLALKDIAISTTGLTRTRGDAGIELADEELVSEGLLDLVSLAATGLLCSDVGRDLASVGGNLAELNTVVLEIPGTEGVGIDLDDAVADEGVLTDKLVVGGVVDHSDDAAAEGNALSGP